uniref:Transmembrane protein 70 homolog, mitochondrial (inferred by orthology to a human protein) n=1 Tax=Strongyloides venezuelensis TaxID=75913 RepID=A0A0K0FZU2_STRVS
MLFVLKKGLLHKSLNHTLLTGKLLLKSTNTRNVSLSKVILSKTETKLVPLASLDQATLGHSILYLKENGAKATPTDSMRKGVIAAKIFSLSSSALGVVMIPALTNYLWVSATEHPSMMIFTILANTFLGILTFTPLLLHVLVKRFVSNIYYNHDTKTFTSIHYNFFLKKMAMHFKASDVVDPDEAPEAKRLYLPLATVFIKGMPLLVTLDKNQYRDQLAFEEMTKGIKIPKDAD